MAVINGNQHSGTSYNNILHFAQEVVSGRFRRWDYHSAEANIAHYGQEEPPDYDLTKVSAPVALHYGQNDWLDAIVVRFKSKQAEILILTK